jgi:hypothetical protein
MLTWVSQLQNAWKPVGFLPKLVCGPSKDTDGFRNAKRQLHFDCLEALLSSVIQVFEAGGFYAYIPALQETQCFLPVVAFIMQDSKEGDFLTGIRTGVLTKFGCRVCFTESRYFCNPFVNTAGHFRHDTGPNGDQEYLREYIAAAEANKQIDGRGRSGGFTAAQIENRGKDLSLHVVRNPLWQVPFGANLMGTHGATPPELLHQWQLGMMKYAWEFVWLIVAHGRTEVSQESRSAKRTHPRQLELDTRFKHINARHADPDLPRKTFDDGGKELNRIEGTHYRALMFHLIVCIGTEGEIVTDRSIAEKVIHVLHQLIDLGDRLMSRDGHNQFQLQRLRLDLQKFMVEFKELFGDLSKSKCCFPKFHYCLHLCDVIEAFGSMRAVDSGLGEATNADTKGLFRKTDKKKTNSNLNLLEKSRSGLAVRLMQTQTGFDLLPVTRPRGGTVDRFTGHAIELDVQTGNIMQQAVALETRKRKRNSEGNKHVSMLDTFTLPERVSSAHILELVREWVGASALESVELYTGLKLTAEGATAACFYRANPHVDKSRKPWYDAVKVRMEEGSSTYNLAAKLVTFVRVVHRPSEHGACTTEMLAVVWLYTAWIRGRTTPQADQANDAYDLADKRFYKNGFGFETLPWPIAVPAWVRANSPKRQVLQPLRPYLMLVNTETISSGLWMQDCLDQIPKQAGARWIIGNPLNPPTLGLDHT